MSSDPIISSHLFSLRIDEAATNLNKGSRPLQFHPSVSTVLHSAYEYVRGDVHTNGIENFWSLLKRTIKGTYVSVEPFHLGRYLDEQAFRYNNRNEMNDFDRFRLALSQIVGKRLTYKALIA